MSEAIERFAAFLELSDKFLARSERDDLEECARMAVAPRHQTTPAREDVQLKLKEPHANNISSRFSGNHCPCGSV
jgi:hypothetical protein